MKNNDELSIRGSLSVEDYQKHIFYNVKKTLIIFFILYFIGFFVLVQQIALSRFWFFVYYFPSTPPLITTSLLGLILSSIITTIILLPSVILSRRKAAKEFKSDQRAFDEIRYLFSDDGINHKSEKADIFFEWDDIKLVIERKEMYQLFFSKNKAICLPKRFFNSDEEIHFFNKIATRNMEASKGKFR